MIFDDIKGNDKLMGRLRRAALSETISHAYIFEGDSCIDKKAVAECFAKAILCRENKGEGCEVCPICRKISHGNHEDIHFLEADGNSIKDEVVEALQEKIWKKPLSGDRNIAIIKDADTMTLRAQNRLLKTLEEPPKGAVLILLSENIENLAQTILSRCIVYRLQLFEGCGYLDALESAGELSDMLLSGAPFYKLKKKLEAFTSTREQSYKLLDALERVYGDFLTAADAKSKLYKKEEIYWSIEKIEEARRAVRQGIGLGYALKNMVIEIGEGRKTLGK